MWEIAPSFRDLLKDTRINFLQDTVAGVHPEPSPSASPSSSSGTSGSGSAGGSGGGRITLESGAELEYDW